MLILHGFFNDCLYRYYVKYNCIYFFKKSIFTGQRITLPKSTLATRSFLRERATCHRLAQRSREPGYQGAQLRAETAASLPSPAPPGRRAAMFMSDFSFRGENNTLCHTDLVWFFSI